MALAVTCFAKMFAMGFLGMSRSEGAANADEAKSSSIVPMVFLAVLCLLLGVLPTYVIPGLNRELQPWTNESTDTLVPPFFASAPAHESLPPAFGAEFHDLGAQVGQDIVGGRGLAAMHHGYINAYIAYVLLALLLALAAGLGEIVLAG